MSSARDQMRALAAKRAERKQVQSRLSERLSERASSIEEVKVPPAAAKPRSSSRSRAERKSKNRQQNTAAEDLSAPTYFNRHSINSQRLWDSPAQPARGNTVDTPEVRRCKQLFFCQSHFLLYGTAPHTVPDGRGRLDAGLWRGLEHRDLRSLRDTCWELQRYSGAAAGLSAGRCRRDAVGAWRQAHWESATVEGCQ